MSSVKRIALYLRTARFLLAKQLIYYVYYLLLKKSGAFANPVRTAMSDGAKSFPIAIPLNTLEQYLSDRNRFRFLNQIHSFGNSINWNFSQKGRLWTYHLNYFEFLFQRNLSPQTGLALIREFVSQRDRLTAGHEPYCISVRIIQWIKFLNLFAIDDEVIKQALRADVRLLERRIEFHLMANHVLENAFALIVASAYFRDIELFKKSRALLLDQLGEQILTDGCHYERSPMYQCTLTNRLLDVINILSHSSWVPQDFMPELMEYASRMLSWLINIQVHGQCPAFQDCSNTLPFKITEMTDYAARLGVRLSETPLGDSKYRRIETWHNVTVLADVGEPSPSYQPGHAHAGALSFVLFHGDIPVIVDPGVSTYEGTATRLLEKSTSYHNTIEVEGMDQSEVWGSFRMGSRASVSLKVDSAKQIVAELHRYGGSRDTRHTREFDALSDRLVIRDTIIASRANTKGIFYLHFHPRIKIKFGGENIFVEGGLQIRFNGAEKIEHGSYSFAQDFNIVAPAPRALIHFHKELISEFTFLQE